MPLGHFIKDSFFESVMFSGLVSCVCACVRQCSNGCWETSGSEGVVEFPKRSRWAIPCILLEKICQFLVGSIFLNMSWERILHMHTHFYGVEFWGEGSARDWSSERVLRPWGNPLSHFIFLVSGANRNCWFVLRSAPVCSLRPSEEHKCLCVCPWHTLWW